MTRAMAALAASFLALMAIVGGMPGGTSAARAQGQPFAAAATIDGMAVTNYQVAQRARFLSLLRVPGSDPASVTETLIDETLQVRAARIAGITLTPEELDAGLVEFAGRANLTPDQFIGELTKAGVAPETFRDFVRNGLYWRSLIQQRFGPRARPTDAQVRSAALGGGGAASVRVLLSEIALPLTPENAEAQQALAERLSSTIRGQAAFEAAARQYSASGTAERGGRIDWLPLAGLAPPIASQVLTLASGEVSEPVNLGTFIALFLLREIDDSAAGRSEPAEVDYAEYLIPGGRTPTALTAAASLRARVDTCDDLYGVAKGQPAGVLTRRTDPVASLPDDLRQELVKLDPNEVSTLLTRDGFLRFVMLCARPVDTPAERFNEIGQSILNQRLSGFAEGYLSELRNDAVIVRN